MTKDRDPLRNGLKKKHANLSSQGTEHEEGIGAWTDLLSVDFYRHIPTILSQPSGAVPFGSDAALNIAKACDIAVRTSLSTLIAGISIPTGYHGETLARELERPVLCREKIITEHNAFKPTNRRISVTQAKRPRGVEGGRFEKLSWASSYEPDGDEVHSYAQHAHNRRVCAYHWRHDNKPRPTIVFLHGFAASAWSLNNYFMRLEQMYHRGYDVVLTTLPHHGMRSGRGRWLSGFNYISGGIHQLNHSVVQSTFDTRYLLDYLSLNLETEKVGLCGMSLGGYTAALMAGLDSRFKFVMPIVPIVSIPDAMLAWRPLDRAIKKIIADHQVDILTLRKTMAAHSPLSFEPLLESNELMIVAGIGDKMAPPSHAEQLQSHWENCNIHWFRGSHVMPLERQQTLQAKLRFFDSIGF